MQMKCESMPSSESHRICSEAVGVWWGGDGWGLWEWGWWWEGPCPWRVSASVELLAAGCRITGSGVNRWERLFWHGRDGHENVTEYLQQLITFVISLIYRNFSSLLSLSPPSRLAVSWLSGKEVTHQPVPGVNEGDRQRKTHSSLDCKADFQWFGVLAHLWKKKRTFQRQRNREKRLL